MTGEALLIKARDLIAEPEHWTKGSNAKDEKGNAVGPWAKGAYQFCSMGALYRASHNYYYSGMCEASNFLKHAMGAGIHYFNDAKFRTHAEVIDAFDRAIIMAGVSNHE